MAKNDKQNAAENTPEKDVNQTPETPQEETAEVPEEQETQFLMFDSRFSFYPAGCVSRYNKQGLCVPQKSQSQPKSADSLGAAPPIPRKERCVWGKMFVLPSV